MSAGVDAVTNVFVCHGDEALAVAPSSEQHCPLSPLLCTLRRGKNHGAQTPPEHLALSLKAGDGNALRTWARGPRWFHI